MNRIGKLRANSVKCRFMEDWFTEETGSVTILTYNATNTLPVEAGLVPSIRARHPEGKSIYNKQIRIQVQQLVWGWFDGTRLLLFIRLVFKCMFIRLQFRDRHHVGDELCVLLFQLLHLQMKITYRSSARLYGTQREEHSRIL